MLRVIILLAVDHGRLFIVKLFMAGPFADRLSLELHLVWTQEDATS
jgi:hypothetical protein